MEKGGKLNLIPLLYNFEENKYLDILNGVEYESELLKNDSYNDACIKTYLLPLDVFNEISQNGKIKEVYTTYEMECLVNGPASFVFDKDAKNNQSIFTKKFCVSKKELAKMAKCYLSEIERRLSEISKERDM